MTRYANQRSRQSLPERASLAAPGLPKLPDRSAGIAAVPLSCAITDIAPCRLDAERRPRIQYTPARQPDTPYAVPYAVLMWDAPIERPDLVRGVVSVTRAVRSAGKPRAPGCQPHRTMINSAPPGDERPAMK